LHRDYSFLLAIPFLSDCLVYLLRPWHIFHEAVEDLLVGLVVVEVDFEVVVIVEAEEEVGVVSEVRIDHRPIL
jgi:hypothetical protein